MKKGLLFLLFLCSRMSYSQTTYSFDVVITYHYVMYKNMSKSHEVIYLINSKDNRYYATISENGRNSYVLDFLDTDNIYVRTTIAKSDLLKEAIAIDCEEVRATSNPYKYQTDNYAFSTVRDTVLDKKTYQYYSLQSIDRKREQEKKLGKNVYIVDPSVPCTPILTFCTAYEEWKLNRNLPEGLLRELHLYNYKGDLISSEKMSHYENIIKKIIIPDCQ